VETADLFQPQNVAVEPASCRYEITEQVPPEPEAACESPAEQEES